ncbi:hypothetical protein REPUB_Repub15cG0057800 [Reevesia pubescens]
MEFSFPFQKNLASNITAESMEKYKSVVSTLPKEDGWTPLLPLCSYQGFWSFSMFIEGAMYFQDHFQAQPTDIFLCSSVKTGSQGPKFPLLATHMPYTRLPKSVIDSGCKIVYLCRDPKDTFVSLWHYLEKAIPNNIISMEDALELLCKGISLYGPYWEHVLGYWSARLEHPDQICFENLSNLEINKTGKHQKSSKSVDNSTYFRKGKVGDWRNYLTAEMGERLDNIMEQKLSGSGLTFHVSSQK